jgi:hypothetical protein
MEYWNNGVMGEWSNGEIRVIFESWNILLLLKSIIRENNDKDPVIFSAMFYMPVCQRI